ncbi:MAG: glycoside hydrolase family 25 protein [Terriglobales bacterium]
MIDVSSWQGRVRWSLCYRDGVRRAGVKLSEGMKVVDPFAATNLRNARRAGVEVFVYHFAHPSNPPLQEAHHFLSTARRLRAIRAGDIVPHLDLEVAEGLSDEQLVRWATVFLRAVDDSIGVAYGCGLYSDASFLQAFKAEYLTRPVWGADYRTLGDWRPPEYWWAWQLSSTGRVLGVRGDVDVSIVRKPPPRVVRFG